MSGSSSCLSYYCREIRSDAVVSTAGLVQRGKGRVACEFWSGSKVIRCREERSSLEADSSNTPLNLTEQVCQ